MAMLAVPVPRLMRLAAHVVDVLVFGEERHHRHVLEARERVIAPRKERAAEKREAAEVAADPNPFAVT